MLATSAQEIAMLEQDNNLSHLYHGSSFRPNDDESESLDDVDGWDEDEEATGPFDIETLQSLEWPKITAYLSSLCKTEWGSRWARRLPFAPTRVEAERELQQVQEALNWLFEQGEELPVHRVKDLRTEFMRLQKGGTLDASSFLEIAHLLDSLSALRRFLQHHQLKMPTLWERGELIEPNTALRREIEQTIAPNGTLRDDASWELGALREQVQKAHEGIRRKVQEYLVPPYNRHLTDSYYTIRQDRYVLPVKASDQSRIPGIVYGSSATGATVYIEPHALVERNNALRIAEHDVAMEELRLLKKLSQRAAQVLPSLQSNLQLLRDLDVVAAKVRLADQMRASVPKLLAADANAMIDLRNARHPLLLRKGIEVVPNDLILGPEGRTLLISGPNTGGKTVALKTMGICALMARAALPIPVEAGSSIPFFESVFTDIGDRQSIEHDLSTFSAQILKLRSILETAQNDTLVLVDEIVVGTDPEQGHALAAAILEALTDARAFVAVTTHYPQLKALPHEDSRFANACVGFQLETLSPTYRLYLGAPGGSSALAIARRLGLSEALCKRAEVLLSPQSDRFERVLNRLEQQYEELYEERERASRARRQLERDRLDLQRQQEELDALRERLLSQEHTEWRNSLREARQTLRETTRSLQQTTAPDWQVVRKVEKQLKETSEQAREAFDEAMPSREEAPPPPAASLAVGQKVFLRSLRMPGEILEAPDANGQVLVRVGTLRSRVAVEDLMLSSKHSSKNPPPSATKSAKMAAQIPSAPRFAPTSLPASPPPSASISSSTPASSAEASSRDSFVSIPTNRNQCDLRGMRVEEALESAEAFLDRAMKEELDYVYLIHGHGTGTLRNAIRELCRHSAYVKQYRPGERTDGGNGVTVVKLAQ